MEKKSWFYKATAWVVTLSLLLQMFPFWPGMVAPRPAMAESDSQAINESLPQSVSGVLPDALAQPISISRAQSTYQAGSEAVVTYTIRNNQGALNLPELNANLTLTDTVDILRDFDPLADPHTIRNLIVRHDLEGAALLDASIWPVSEGNQHIFHLGDLAPLADKTFTITIQLPAEASDFIELDSGATVYGTLTGRAVSATAHPIRLAPDGFAPWLISTPDATLDDTAMLFQTAVTGDDPLALFDLVQNFAYEAYDGSLRGTRGTLWSEAGNSVDQSSLLIAMLRAAGYPARYRHGVLPTADAQALIASMFPAPTAIRGHVPADVETSDPINDPDLLALAQDHWWVEAYLPGSGWTTLDPTVATASPGTTPATPLDDETDQIAELPDAIRHKLHFTLDVEQYHSFPIGGLNLQEMTVLTATAPAAQTAGVPVNIAFQVNTNAPGGLVYATVEHTYTPYLEYGDSGNIVYGKTFSDLLTNFPLATHFTTAVWLEVTSVAPDGHSDTYRRTIKDLLGADMRLGGGSSQLPPRDNTPMLQMGDLIQVQPIPNSGYPEVEATRLLHQQLQQIPDFVAALEAFEMLDESDDPAAIADFTDNHLDAFLDTQFSQLELMRALFQYITTSPDRSIQAETMLVKSYPDRPKLILTSQVFLDDGSMDSSFELLNIAEKAIAYPGQKADAVNSANFLRTTSEKILEYELLVELMPGEVRSAVGTLLAAAEQEIPTRFIMAENLSELDELNIPSDTKAHIANHALAGGIIWVPERMVTMPYGEDIGFLVVDPEGNASYINAEGYMAAAAKMYGMLVRNVVAIQAGLAFLGGFGTYILSFLYQVFVGSKVRKAFKRLKGLAGKMPKDTYLQLLIASIAAIPLPIASCNATPNPPACQGGVMAGYLYVNAAIAAAMAGGLMDPSLPSFWVNDLPPPPLETRVVSTQTIPANLPAGAVTLDVQAEHHWATSSNLANDWVAGSEQVAHFDTLSAASATLSQGGVVVGSGSVTAVAGDIHFAAVERPWTVNGEVALAGYGAVGSELALSAVGAYTAVADGDLPLIAQLRTPQAILNDTDLFAGNLVAEFDSPILLHGAMVAPVSGSTSNHSYDLDDGRLMASGLEGGAIIVGGIAVNDVQSAAIAGYSGEVALTAAGTHDQVELNGLADFFALSLASDINTNTLSANENALLLPTIHTNYSDTYRIIVNAPEGWHVGLDLDGQIIVTPTAQAAVGTATLLATAYSTQYPDLFAWATIDFEVASSEGVAVDVVPDPLLTIPMGEIQGSDYESPLTLNHRGDGQAEAPGAAFNVIVHNQSTATMSYDLSVTGLPAGWAVWSLDQSSVTLSPGAAQTVGLYVVPPPGPLPAAGANFPFIVTAIAAENPTINDTAEAEFVMPEVPFPYLAVDPLVQTIAPGDPVTISLRVQNVGNHAASFPLTATVRASHFSTAILSPTLLTSPTHFETGLLAANAEFNAAMLLTTTAAVPGATYFVHAQTTAGEFAPQAMAAIEVASLLTAPLIEATVCLPDPMAMTTAHLARTIMTIENNCQDGNCPADSRQNLLNAIDNYLGAVGSAGYPVDIGPVTAARHDVAAAETAAELLAALEPLVMAVLSINETTCLFTQHRVSAQLTPWMDAALPGQTASYNLAVANRGTLTTTYAVTVTLPQETLLFEQTLLPGTAVTIPVSAAGDQLGLYSIEAVAAVIPIDEDMPELTAIAEAYLNVVDRFVQVMAVAADPDFVETGVSTTTLQAEIANVAGLRQEVTADVAILSPSGAVSWSDSLPLSILSGSPRLYELGTVSTSGWSQGVYTVTLSLSDDGGPLTGGSGYGYLVVGQGLHLSHSVSPQLATPGTVTVTTAITTAVMTPPTGTLAVVPASGLRDLSQYPVATDNDAEELLMDNEQSEIVNEDWSEPEEFLTDEELAVDYGQLWFSDEESTVVHDPPVDADESFTIHNQAPSEANVSQSTLLNTSGMARYEQDVLAYSGSWSTINQSWTSGGQVARSNTAGDVASFTFEGTWVGIGFSAGTNNGHAEIFINGESQGIVDTYSRYNDVTAVYFDNLINGTHTISVTVLGTSNPFASNHRVEIDYVDVWDGTPLPDGSFEEEDERVYLSNGWVTASDGAASGGQYIRSQWANTHTNAWFHFTGDSITFQALAYNGAGMTKITIDGESVGVFDLYSATPVTRTFSFDNLGPGAHVLQLRDYRGRATVDRFVTPGEPPFHEPPDPVGFTRYEEDHPDLRYNGAPWEQTATSWNMATYGWSSGGYGMWSDTVSDTVSLTFEGEWVSVGLITRNTAGLAEIFIDGESQGIVDTYSRYDDVLTLSYDLTPGTHTITVTVLGEAGAFNNQRYVRVDYIDVWDGTAIADGSFEENDERVYLSPGWVGISESAASGGRYIRSQWATTHTNAWFNFVGDSVTFQALAYSGAGMTRIAIDGEVVGVFDLYSATTMTRTFSFDNLGPGAHVLELRDYRGRATVDRFVTPGEPPFYEPPAREGIVRYEEDDPAILYNGDPWEQTATSWNMATYGWSSGGYGMWSNTAGDTISFTFDGEWVSLGLITRDTAGLAEIFIDGVSQGIVDTYSRYDDVLTLNYDLTPGSHTISVTVLGESNDFSNQQYVRLDYIDVWDGTAVPDGSFEENDERVYLSPGWVGISESAASGGRYIRSQFASTNSHAWFPFVGESISFQALAYSGAGPTELRLNGQRLGIFDLYSAATMTRTFSFDNLGPGPHVLHVTSYRGRATVDRFVTPGEPPFYEPPAREGVVRYEEDDPALLYNGVPFDQKPTSWSEFNYNHGSSGYGVWSDTAGDTVSLTFDGEWVGVGFMTYPNAGLVEIFIDGESQGIVNTYSPEPRTKSVYYPLSPGTHTITVTVLGQFVPPATAPRSRVDYIDVWDGTPMPDGNFEEWDERLHLSNGWVGISEAAASDGRYIRSQFATTNVNAWFPFTGDSVTYQALAYSGAGQADILLDGHYIGTYDLYSSTPMTRTFSFGNLGDGPHMLQLHYNNNGRVTLDRFDQPGEPPFIPHYAVDWIPVTMFPTGRSGDTAVTTVNLHNQGIQPDSYDLFVSGNGWPVTIIPTTTLAPTEVQPIEISVAIPSGTPLGESDTFTITAVSQTDGSITAVETITVYAGQVDAQLCIAMDGSGSISPSEFELMVGGLAEAMRDATAVPRNATVEFSIIQFAGSTRTEIAPVVIVDEDAAEWVAQQIEQIPHLGGGTPMQDAIDLCTELLMNSPHTTHAQQQVINMVTDGEPNNPGATITARNNAIAAGVDQINAEAIGVTEAAIAFLRDELVYPEPGYEAPPFIPGQGGFVIRADTFEEFVESIGQKVGFALDTGYIIELSHHVPLTAVGLLTSTIAPPPDAITGTAEADTLFWAYSQFAGQEARVHTLQTVLPDMQPGETRAVSLGTEVYYRLSGGENWLSLPPLYVTAGRILEIAPAEQTVGVGATAVYTITLLNPGLSDDLYSLEVAGLPAEWLSYPAQVNVPAQSSVEVLLEVTTPANAELTERPFLVTATTGSGSQDMATASLTLFNGLDIAIDPPEQTAPTGTAVTYTLTLTNNQLSTVNYQLSTDGLAQVDLPDEVEIGGETAVSIPVIVSSQTYGPLPFSVTAAGDGGQDSASAVLNAVGHYAVGLALDPEENVAGPATPALFDLIVTNLGDTVDSYDLSLNLPAGWSASLDANGAPVNQISLPPHIFNSASLRLLVTPDVTAVPGSYEFGVTATSQSGPGVQAAITGTVEVLPLGVQVAIAPQATTMSPLDNGLWQMTITNTGSVADSFALNATGIVSLTAGFSSSSVTLNPGQSQTVQMTTDPLPFALPQTYPFWVMATSQSDERIVNAGDATVTFTGYEGVEAAWLPASQTVTDTLSASYMLIITNTGNILTNYHIELEMPGLSGQLPFDELPIPARSTAVLPLTVYAGGPGTYNLTATAVSDQGTSDSDTAELTIVFSNQPPIVDAGPDQTVVVNSLVQFNGSASDPDDDPLTFAWDFGDGNGATGTLTPTHVYTAVGLYTVTLTVSDPAGHVVSDTLQVTVVAEEIFAVSAGPDMAGYEGSPLAFNGIITDTAGAEPYTILWDFGDGGTAEGSLTPIHTYADNGTYTVTLTVTNSENQAASDNLVVTIHNVPPTVTAIDDQTLVVGETLAGVLAAFSDPGWLDTHTAEIDWGDGVVTAGVVDQAAQTVSGAHAYTAPGVYTVTITVTDKDGGQGSDTLLVSVSAESRPIFLPIILKGN